MPTRRSLMAAAVLFALPAAAAQPLRIVMIGDSITAGLGLKASDAPPAQLQALLQAKGLSVEIGNAGVSGDTIADGYARVDWALAGRVDAVIVALGANDMLRGRDPAQARAALDQLLAKIAARRVPILVVGMRASRNLGEGYAARFDPIFPEMAEKYGTLLAPFLLEGVALNPSLNQADGLHPNPAGAAVIARTLLPKVEELLKRIP